MSKFNPFDPANGYSEEDRVALETKCASLINRAYRNPFPGASLRHDGADNAGIFFAKQLAHITSITAPRTVEDGSSTRLTIKLKQASINSTDMANISVKYIRGGTSKKNTGAGQKSSSSTSGTQKDEKATKSSILCSGAKAIGLFK